jgi:hypothetical protein
MTRRMLADSVRRSSRHSKVETSVAVMSRSSFSRSLSRSDSGLALRDSGELSEWSSGIGEVLIGGTLLDLPKSNVAIATRANRTGRSERRFIASLIHS